MLHTELLRLAPDVKLIGGRVYLMHPLSVAESGGNKPF
jgi:hypothetical protein